MLDGTEFGEKWEESRLRRTYKRIYICFSQDLAQLLLEILNHSVNHRELSYSQKQSMITFIERKQRDKRFSKNWRPNPPIETPFALQLRRVSLGQR